MLGKTVVIILVILLALIILLPFVLTIAGFNVLEFGAIGGGPGRGDAIVMRSLNGGETWEDVSLSDNERVSFPRVIFDLEFHPSDAGRIFLGSRGAGLWMSGNGGAIWSKINDNRGVLNPRADVYKVAVSRSSPRVMYAAVFQDRKGRVLRSEDGGGSFREVYFVTADGFGVFDLFINPSDENHVRIVTGQGGVLETKNGGKTWHVVRWFTNSLRELLVNPKNTSEMFVITDEGNIFKSSDDGVTWADLPESAVEKAGTGFVDTSSFNPLGGFNLRKSTGVQVFTPSPSDFSTLYIGSGEGLLRSQDGGFTWERLKVLIPPEALPVSAVVVHPQAPQTIFAGANAELHRTDDGGTNWNVRTFPQRSRIQTLLINPLAPEVMFAIFGR